MRNDSSLVLLRVGRNPETSTGHPRHLFPPLDLKYIQAAILKEMSELVPVVDGYLPNETPSSIVEKALSFHPDVVIVNASTPSIREAVEVGTRLKETGAVIVAIGQHVRHVCEVPYPGWEDAFEIPILGDPEQEVPHLVARIKSGETREELVRFYTEHQSEGDPFLVLDPDALPWPKFTRDELYDYPFPFPLMTKKIRRWGYVLSSWGCPYHCRHCSLVVRKTEGTVLRKRNTGLLIDEVEALVSSGAQAISFEDDTVLYDRHHFLSICREIGYRRLQFPWIANARADEIDDEVAETGRNAGVSLFKVSVESGSPRMIENLGKSSSGEDWINHAKNTFHALRCNNISSVALFMVGSPEETPADVKKSIALACELEPEYIQVQVFSLYPDIPLFNDLVSSSDPPLLFGNQFHYATPLKSPSRIAAGKILQFQTLFYRKFYLRPRYLLHHIRSLWRSYLMSCSTLVRGLGIVLWLIQSRARTKDNTTGQIQ